MNAPDSIFRNAVPTEEPDPVVAEDWEPIVRDPFTEAQVEAWIADFAESGYIEQECGNKQNLNGKPLHAIARQWIADKDKVGEIIGPSFFKWAKACAYIARF